MTSTSFIQQLEELETLESIYENQVTRLNTTPQTQTLKYQIAITDDAESDNKTKRNQKIILTINCDSNYPSQNCPAFVIEFVDESLEHKLNRHSVQVYIKQISQELENAWIENEGECIVFEWVSLIPKYFDVVFNDKKNYCNNHRNRNRNNNIKNENGIHCNNSLEWQEIIAELPKMDIIWCETKIEDKKSVFQSYMAYVTNMSDIYAFLIELKSIKRIAKATHNMYAYRIKLESNHTSPTSTSPTKTSTAMKTPVIDEYFDDDGEHGGGRVILEILKKRNVLNRIVMVSRWYGGILLHANRFKDIKKCTQMVLEQRRSPTTTTNTNGNNHNNNNNNNTKGNHGHGLHKPTKKIIKFGKKICDKLATDANANVNHHCGKSILIECKSKSISSTLVAINLEEYVLQSSQIEWIQNIWCSGQLLWQSNPMNSKAKQYKNITIGSIQRQISKIHNKKRTMHSFSQ